MKILVCALVLAAPVLVLSEPAGAAQPPSCSHPTIVGTDHHDRLVGTAGSDVIAGLGGDDVLDGRGGDDLLCGGPGADFLRGGEGDDQLLGGLDRISHDARVGRLSEGDRLDGGRGDDWLDGGHDARADVVDIGTAVLDTLDFSRAPGGVTVRLDLGQAEGFGTDHIVVRGRYEVRTGPHADVVVGSNFQESILTGSGADDIRSGGGADWVWADERGQAPDDDVVLGGRGNDILYAEEGSDQLSGGPGRDQVSDDGLVGVDRLRGDGGGHDLVTNVISAEAGEHADGGSGPEDYIWNTDDVHAHPHAVMTCVGFELLRSSGPWC